MNQTPADDPFSFDRPPASAASPETECAGPPGALTEADAVKIWIARWLRIRRKDLMARYGCESSRLYEIWWGERFPMSEVKARQEFAVRYPGLVDRTAFGYRRIPRKPSSQAETPGEQLSLFD